MPERSLRSLVPLSVVFFLSGFAALVYEVVWTRLFGYVAGNSLYSVTAVLAAFMGGLALGAYLGGRRAPSSKRPILAYAVLEVLIGVSGFLVPVAIGLLERGYPYLANAIGAEPGSRLLFAARFGLGVLVLLVPTTLMGATLPYMIQGAARSVDRLGRTVGLLYGINTAGAFAGALAAGLILIPALGMRASTGVAAAINLAVAAAAFVLARRGADAGAAEPDPLARPEPPALETLPLRGKSAVVLPPAARVLVLAAFAVAAAASMVDQVAWTRVLSLLVGPTTYAFTLMVSAFILGLAIGGWLGGLVVDRLRDRLSAFAGLEMLIGLSCLGLVPVLGALPDHLVDPLYLGTLQMPFAGAQALIFSILFLLLFVPTALMGFAFPLVARLTAEDGRSASRSVGLSASWNTIGAICGSLAGGFLLVPWLGIQKSLYAAVALNVAAALLAVAARTYVKPFRLASLWPAALVPAFLLVLAVPPWNMSVLTSGLYLYANLVYGGSGGDQPYDIASALSLMKPVFHSEGLMTTITVEENPDGIRFLKVGGKTDASNGDDMRTQLLLGHVPALFNPDARQALVIGLGSGVSVGAVLRHPGMARVDCVEISPEMVGAAHCFDEWNGDCLSDPRMRLVIEDARNYLLLGRAKYDIICSEPSNPWIAGVGTLFTREFFDLCRRSLESDGVLCQWVSLTRMRPEEFRAVVRTFTEVFPESVLLSVLGRYDFLLLGKAGGSAIGLPWARARETLRSDDVFRQRDEAGLSTPEDILLTYVAGGETLRAFASGADLVTDDRNSLEMSMARNLNRWVSLLEVFRPIHELRSDPFDMLDLRGLPAAEVATVKEASRRAHEAAVATGEADLLLLENEETPTDAATMAERIRSARARLERALDLCPTSFEASSLLVPILLQEGQDLFADGRTAEALDRLRRAHRLRPAHREARALLRDHLLHLARASLDSGDAANAAPLLAEAHDLDPASAAVARLRAAAFRLEGKDSDRVLELERAHRLDPGDFETLSLLVDSYSARGEGSRAIEVYERAVERDPRSAALHEGFAALLYYLAVSGGDPRFLEKAASHGEKARSLEPDRAESSLVLGLIRFSQGRFAEARDLSERTLAHEPAISDRETALRVLASALAKLGEREKALDALERLLREPGVERASLESDPILGSLLRERPLAPAEADRPRGSGD